MRSSLCLLLTLATVSLLAACGAGHQTIDLERSGVGVDRGTVAGDRTDAVRIIVLLYDTRGEPMPGVSTRIVAEADGRSQAFFPGPTDEGGETMLSLGSGALLTLTLRAEVKIGEQWVALRQRPTVTFVPGPPAQVTLYPNLGSVRAGDLLPHFYVSATDGAGHATQVPGEVVLSLGQSSTASRLEGTLRRTIAGAPVEFTDVRILGAGKAVLAVSIGGAIRFTSTPFDVVPGDAVALSLDWSPPAEVVAGEPLAPDVRVRAVDALGNPTSSGYGYGTQVLPSLLGGMDGALVGRKWVALQSGVATLYGLGVSRAGEGYRLVVRGGGLTEAISAPFSVRTGAAAAQSSSLQASPAWLEADGATAASLRLQLLDTGGNPVPDAPVQLSVEGGDAVLTPASGTGRTDARGLFVASLTSSSTGTRRVRATAGTLTLETEVHFVPVGTPSVALPGLPVQAWGIPAGAATVADLDRDGRLDVVDADGIAYRNEGGGRLAAWPGIPQEAGGAPAVGDVDGDGAPDVVFAGPGMPVRFNSGDGGLLPPIPLLWGVTPKRVALGDVNGDGRTDVVAFENGSSSPYKVYVLLGQEGGQFAPPVVSGFNSWPADFALLPPAGGRTTWEVALLFDSEGAVRRYRVDAQGQLSLVATSSLPLGSYSSSGLVAGDLNADGHLDLLVGSTSWQKLQVLDGREDGSFAAARTLDVGASMGRPALGDVDGDGWLDVLAWTSTTGSSTLWQWRNDGQGGLRAPTQLMQAPSVGGLALGDVSGDGRPELVVSLGSGVFPLLNRGDGTFLLPRSLGTAYYAFPIQALALADFNADGRADVAAGSSMASSLVLSQPDGGVSVRGLSVLFDPVAGSLASGDVNADGQPDLLAISSGRVQVLANLDGGTFASAVAYDAGTQPTALAVGDVDGDQRLDAVVGHSSGSTVDVLRNDGAGGLLAPTPLQTGAAPRAVALADLDGDGDLDLAVACADEDTVRIFRNDAGALVPLAVRAVGRGPVALAVAEMDGDGRPDLVVANGLGQSVSVLSAAGESQQTAGLELPLGVTPQSLTLGDFNGDGWTDIAFSPGQGGRLGLRLSEGGGHFGPLQWQGAVPGLTQVLAHDWDGDGQLDVLAAGSKGVQLLPGTHLP